MKVAVLALTTGTALALGLAAQAAGVRFERDIRPVLSENCFKCHGPDADSRKAELRFDQRESAVAPRDDGAAVVPGEPDKSEMIRRITSTDSEEKMPPPRSGKKLSPQQIELLKEWIAEKAPYQKHWSFLPPVRPAIPKVKDATWVRNPIDAFILSRLQREGLKPAPEADRATLIRRVTLDLTGLPPTPAEIDAFLNDTSPDAYEKVVDRLLANPHYGERMAVEWLDAARFADTHGFHIDSGRDMTRWREWVIDAFNNNMRFDEFTVEQLAGDLLPNATLDQKIASGFNRNHMINFEGGAIPAEYEHAYLIDRVNTTSTVWLGLTMNCCQCHDHKYDPLAMRDYYSMYAFFNNVPENGLDGAHGNAAPFIKAPTKQEQKELASLSAQIAEARAQVEKPDATIDQGQSKWESAARTEAVRWTTLTPMAMQSQGGATLKRLEDGSILATGQNPAKDIYTITAPAGMKAISAIRIEALPDDSLTAKGPGRSGNGNLVMTGARLTISADGALPARMPKFGAASADFSQQNFPVTNLLSDKPTAGWAIYPNVGKRHCAILQLQQPAAVNPGTPITITMEFESGFGQHQLGRFRLSVTSAEKPIQPGGLPANIASLLASPSEKLSDAQRQELRKYYRENISPELKPVREQLAALEKRHKQVEDGVRTVMVMQEMAKPRDTFIHLRGLYDKLGEKVTANTPAVLPPLPPGAPHNRLGLARWLVSGQHPLTARVTVNRYWEMYFGEGIVKTVGDFGSQGEYPVHPQLLDWLATEFVRTGWDVKRMQRLLVTSATYRQSSVVTPQLYQHDPEDRLLARGPRFRLEAEFIRDQALAISGLLDPEIGGKSVYPYQPAGLWSELMSRTDGANWTAQVFVQSHGKDLYRRSMYTFWKRTSPPPQLTTFDAPDREVCTVRRSRTNTPLQALILENDPTYVEASRKLAERILKEAPSSTDERISFAFRLATARNPRPPELAVLRNILEKQRESYRQNPEMAKKLLSNGESPSDATIDPVELGSWTMVASTILNLDEVVTKN